MQPGGGGWKTDASPVDHPGEQPIGAARDGVGLVQRGRRAESFGSQDRSRPVEAAHPEASFEHPALENPPPPSLRPPQPLPDSPFPPPPTTSPRPTHVLYP